MFSFLQNKRLTAEETTLVRNVQETEQQVELEQNTVETHQFETNRVSESEETVITERTGRSSHEARSLQSDLRNNGTSSQKLSKEVKQKEEKESKIQVVEILASTRKENQKGLQSSNEEHANLSQQLQQRESELCQAQETIDGLRNQLAEKEKMLNTERIRTLQITTSLQSNVQHNSERSLRLFEEGRQKVSMLQAEKDSNSQLEKTLESTKKECEDTLERSKEEGARLRQRYVKSQSELRQGQETIVDLRNQLAESAKIVNTERATSFQITTSLESDLQEIRESLKENEEMLKRSKEER